MEQQNQNNTPDGSGDVPMKRKRGRPRKYPRPDSEESSYMQLSQNKRQTPVRVEQAPVPPGFQAVNGNQHLQRGQESESNSNDAMVGQVVTGVVEAVFDAGFLLSVRVGNSDTILKGLVFKSGHFVPVGPGNDVAPGVPMIQRNEVPFPSRPTQFQTPLPKEKNGQPASVSRIETLPMNGSQSAPQVPIGAVSSSNLAVASRNVPSLTGQTPDQVARGNAVPVLFQPNFSNGMPVSTPPLKVYQVPTVRASIVSKEIPVGGNQVLTSPAQTTSQNSFPSRVQSQGFPTNYQSSSDAMNKIEDKSLPVVSVPFEKLVTEDVKRIETPPDVMDAKTGNSMLGDNIVVKDTSAMQEDKVNDLGQPVLIQPLQAEESHVEESSAPKASICAGTGQMTELLQEVLQNNKAENQESKAAEAGSGDKLNDISSFGTGLQDAGAVHSTNPF